MIEQIKIEAVCAGLESGEFSTVAIGYLRAGAQPRSSGDLEAIFRVRDYRPSELDTGQSAFRVMMVSAPGKNVTVGEVRRVLEAAGPSVRFA